MKSSKLPMKEEEEEEVYSAIDISLCAYKICWCGLAVAHTASLTHLTTSNMRRPIQGKLSEI